MADLEIRIVVERFDINNDAQVNAVYAHFDATVSRICDTIVITLTVPALGVDGTQRVDAARAAIQRLEQISGAHAVDLDLDLVDVGEIAARTSKTRQAISLLATGKRGADFPSPYASPGGHRVWTWASVNTWLMRNRPDWADPMDHLTRLEQREVAAWITDRCRARRAQVGAGAVALLELTVVSLETTDDSGARSVKDAYWGARQTWTEVDLGLRRK